MVGACRNSLGKFWWSTPRVAPSCSSKRQHRNTHHDHDEQRLATSVDPARRADDFRAPGNGHRPGRDEKPARRMATVSAEIQQSLATARTEAAALDVQREDLKRTLVADRAAWDATVEQRRADLERECAERLRDVEAREQSVTKVEAQASADAAAAATLRDDLDQRVRRVQSIAGRNMEIPFKRQGPVGAPPRAALRRHPILPSKSPRQKPHWRRSRRPR